ncbi:ABC transporter ATP-binding protein [Gordonia prachuapensis]|uniref:ABC transporter ATP-binding protein n=1 Tax=Gordonia prachuapensis TaxID=3115651 RepID=UPI003D663F99
MSPVIDVSGLTKRYGRFHALRGLDLAVQSGEIHGFLGPNGAGKTTTIRTLLGLLKAGSGRAEVFGLHPRRDAMTIHGRLAYVPGDVNLWPSLTGGEVIDILANLRGGINPARRSELLDRFALDPTRKCSTYSKGNRQKVALVAAFATDVELFILDEPTSGLDPLMERQFSECIRDVAREGKTVLLSSHILPEVEKLCDRATIIRDGRTVESLSLAELRAVSGGSIEIEDLFMRHYDTSDHAVPSGVTKG